MRVQVEKTWIPAKCAAAARRKDFVTFHYKVLLQSAAKSLRNANAKLSQVFTEEGKKVHQTYGEGPVTIQLGVGMTMPGLDKVCALISGGIPNGFAPNRLSPQMSYSKWFHLLNSWKFFIKSMSLVQAW